MSRKKIALSWSGGKDAAYALYQLLQDKNYEVVVLLTTFHKSTDRSSMHGHLTELIREQIAQIDLPIYEIWIPESGGDSYGQTMQVALENLQNQYNITGVAFGDLFLEEVREYRIKNMKPTGLDCIFPIWGEPTSKVAQELIQLGFQTKICCTTVPTVDPQWLGKDFSEEFLRANPEIDPCGENGEFHTFVYNAPYFKDSINVELGKEKYVPVPEKFQSEHGVEGHWYIDILPNS